MPDILIDIGGHRFEVTRTERFLLPAIDIDRRGGIAGTIYRTGRKGWSLELALGDFALFIGYSGNSFHAAMTG